MSIPGANPPDHDPGSRTISEATRCVCGHRWDEHTSGICTEPDRSRPYIGSIYAHDLCPCSRFEPAERDEQ